MVYEHRKILFVIALCEFLAVVLVSAIDPHAHIDGEVYRLGAQAWWNGQPIYHDLPPTEVGLRLPFIYPPFAAVAFTPLALVSKTVAVALIMFVSHVALLVTLYVILRTADFGPASRRTVLLITAAVLPLATLVEPVRETLTYAQINLVLMALVAVDCLWRADGHRKLPYPRGVLLGIAAGLKLTPAVFLLFFLLRRDLRAIVTTVVTFLATVALGFLLAFDDAREFWLHEVFASSDVSFGPQFTGDASIYAGNVSLRSLLSKLAVPEPWLSGCLGVLILLLAGLAVFGMLAALRPRNGQRRDYSTALVINAVFGLLISPISWSHHWVWVVPGLVLLFGRGYTRRDWPLLVSLGLAVELYLIGPHWLVPQGDGKELTWNFFEHLIGNAYVYLGVGFLVYHAFLGWQARYSNSETRTPVPTTPNPGERSTPEDPAHGNPITEGSAVEGSATEGSDSESFDDGRARSDGTESGTSGSVGSGPTGSARSTAPDGSGG
ncbi:alpha-1,2-mannosyltransferase [Actinopolyspora mzabensis]|uniref:Alpha-1,2-mannosyltransferase n=1 Tax=Actinopolyspora mzabensis TaxID=995066 RepID=A0A1G9FHQ1_ACTMZ|nr:glycosyltransferase 87 family protein [Actinopolyspora mzabensis]SDK87673.1 alpha-1,2-mannosyltransferase [Actinopolyspora mzabensis]